MMLDETLRHRVAEIAAADMRGLDEAAEERVLRRLATDGPRIVRNARRARLALMSAGPLLAAAAAAAIIVPHAPGAGGLKDRSAMGAAREAAAVAKVGGACAGRAVPAAAGFVAGADGARLDLGAVATAVAERASDVRLAEMAPCRTVIALGMGRVSVHAKDLGGGELKVRARDAEVTVHGTIFAVTQDADSLVVEVAEGRVEVNDRVGRHWVSTGERLLVSSVGVAQGALAPERSRALRGVVGAPVVVGLETLEAVPPAASASPAPGRAQQLGRPALEVVSPSVRGGAPAAPAAVVEAAPVAEAEAVKAPSAPPSPGDLLARADEARHAGDYASARDLYRRAATGQGPTAEAAWVALARMELSLGHAAQARDATKQRQEHFGQGTLAPESLWIDVRTYRQTGDLGHARALADELVRRWPSSPQARAAAQWLSND